MDTNLGHSRGLPALWSALAVVTGLAAAPSADAQQGSVTGQVVATETQQPLSGAQVSIPGLSIGTVTGANGRYVLSNVPVGSHSVEARLIGFQRVIIEVTVAEDETVTADFVLPVSAIGLEELVVTATGVHQRREVGHSTSRINAAAIVDVAPVRDIADLLSDRIPGVAAEVGGGTLGAGTVIRIRGASGLATSNQPIVYIDGARVDASEANLTVSTGGRGKQTGALAINPADIESIEVLSGASAATLYGTDAARGVIRITTKNGMGMADGVTQWRAWLEGGLHVEPNAWPANWRGVTSDGSPCPLTSVASGACTQAELRSFNLLKDPSTTPFSTGSRQHAGVSLQGRSGGLHFYSSGEFESSQGVYRGANELSALNLRGNFGARLSDVADLRVNSSFRRREVTLPINDNSIYGLIANGILGGAAEDAFFLFSFDEILTIDTRQETDQFIGSAEFEWRPADWLTGQVTSGIDVSNNKDQQLYPVGGIPSGLVSLGQRTSNATLSQVYTAGMFIRGDLPISNSIRSSTTVGSQFFVDRRRTVFARGEELIPGSNSITTAARTTADEITLEARTLGLFAQQRFAWRDRLFATAGVRVDDNSAFGVGFRRAVYPSLNVSWVVSDEPWFDPGRWLGDFRLRAAAGQAGNQPGTTDAVPYFRAVPVTHPRTGSSVTGVTFDGGNLGNPNLKPERTTEYEIGFEASLFNNLLTVSTTVYNSDNRDLLIRRILAPSLGSTEERWENLARTRNRGVEGRINLASAVKGVDFSLDFTGSYNDNKLLELGEGVAPIQVSLELTEHREGYPLGSFWDPKVSFEDRNGDGIISPDELSLGESQVYLGRSEPPVQLSFTPSLSFFEGNVNVRSQWVAHLGHQAFDKTEGLRCLLGSARARHDPGTPLDRQAYCLAAAFIGIGDGFVYDADFLRFQELSVSLRAPRSWAERLPGENISLMLSGRNLGVWTGYPGLDPQTTGYTGRFRSGEELTQPPIRYWSARLTVGF